MWYWFITLAEGANSRSGQHTRQIPQNYPISSMSFALGLVVSSETDQQTGPRPDMDAQPKGTTAVREAEDVVDSRSREVNGVFLSCFDQDVRFFTSMLCIEGIRLHCACTVEMADFLLLATRGTVFVSDTTFLDGSWQDALAMIRTVHPLVATLICADLADRQFVAGAHERGAIDVLWRPLELDRLRSSIRAAHELTSERSLWAAEREHERRSHQNSVSGFCLEALK